MTTTHEPQPNAIATLSTVNQMAAGLDPEQWAKLQAKGDPEAEAALLALALEWREYMLWLAKQPDC